MPLLPLPANNTTRFFFDYVSGGADTSKRHTVQMRVPGPPDTDADTPQAAFLEFLQSIGEDKFAGGWRVESVRVQAEAAIVTLPVTMISTLAAFEGSAANIAQPLEAREWTWQGRSFYSGRRVDLSLYGINEASPAKFRFPVGGSSPSWVGTSVDALNGFTDFFWAIDGSDATWKYYVNSNFNSYWESQIRKS